MALLREQAYEKAQIPPCSPMEAQACTQIVSEAQRVEHFAAAAEEIELRLSCDVSRILGSVPTPGEKNAKENPKPNCDLDRLSIAINRLGYALEGISRQLERVRGI